MSGRASPPPSRRTSLPLSSPSSGSFLVPAGRAPSPPRDNRHAGPRADRRDCCLACGDAGRTEPTLRCHSRRHIGGRRRIPVHDCGRHHGHPTRGSHRPTYKRDGFRSHRVPRPNCWIRTALHAPVHRPDSDDRGIRIRTVSDQRTELTLRRRFLFVPSPS